MSVEATVVTQRGARNALAIATLCLLFALPALGGDDAQLELRSLDEQVQEVKSDVLAIATELDQLEERLLYPSNTQVAVFVSLAAGDVFRLDSLQIQIDGEPVARHVYSFKELEALQKGGVQRIYTGNVAAGDHRIDVSIAGKSPNGEDFTESQSFGFNKDVPPKLLEITLSGEGAGVPGIRLGDS
ncbi:MAG TPA: hypothetical protein VFT98_18665 [Myxococcota bacterium]|nr:hypothetical protein [Myxococcota bacterium]